jgi:hypothetical protein
MDFFKRNIGWIGFGLIGIPMALWWTGGIKHGDIIVGTIAAALLIMFATIATERPMGDFAKWAVKTLAVAALVGVLWVGWNRTHSKEDGNDSRRTPKAEASTPATKARPAKKAAAHKVAATSPQAERGVTLEQPAACCPVVPAVNAPGRSTAPTGWLAVKVEYPLPGTVRVIYPPSAKQPPDGERRAVDTWDVSDCGEEHLFEGFYVTDERVIVTFTAEDGASFTEEVGVRDASCVRCNDAFKRLPFSWQGAPMVHFRDTSNPCDRYVLNGG